MRNFVHALVAGVGLATLVGCGDNSGPAVKIGLNVELSGDVPAVGASSRNAAQLFVDEVNAEGGLDVGGTKLPIRLIIGDNGARAEQAVSVTQRLISMDNVLAMVGPNASVCAVPASQIAQDLKCPMISPWSTNPKTTVEANSDEPKSYVFRACFIDTFQAQVLAKFALNTLKAKTAAVLYDMTSEAPTSQASLFKKVFEENGGQVVSFETYSTGDKDFSPQLTKIKTTAPDIIFLPAYYNDVPLIAQQARRLGIEAQFVGSDAWSSPEIIKLGGKEIEGAYFCNHYSTQIATPAATGFMEAYQTKYNQDPDDVAALTYDAMGLLSEAIKAAGKLDREAVRNALAGVTEYEGVTGTMRFGEGSGDPIKSAVILKIKDGAFEWVENAAP